VTAKGAAAVAPILGEVQLYCRGLPPLPETAVAMAIEQKFGDRLLTEICIPNEMTMGACLIVLLALLQGGTLH
jgi:hypothetical protein